MLVLSVGGGGLLCGVIEGLIKVGWPDVPVVAVETEGAASLARSVKGNNGSGRRSQEPAPLKNNLAVLTS